MRRLILSAGIGGIDKDRKFNLSRLIMRGYVDLFDINGGNPFAPYGLPNAALSRVPNLSSVQGLLTVGFVSGIGIVGNFNEDFRFTAVYKTAYIKRERPVSPRMGACFFTVDIDGTMLVYRSEMQEKPFPLLAFFKIERSTIPQGLTGKKLPLYI